MNPPAAEPKPTHPDLVLGILLPEPAADGHGHHHRQRGAAGHPARPPCHHRRSAMGGRCLHARDRQPPDSGGFHGGPFRPAACLPGRHGCLHRRFAAVQSRADHRWIDRVPRRPGPRCVHAQPGGPLDHLQHVPGPQSTRTGHWSLGGGGRAGAGHRTGRRGNTHREPRLALGLLGESAHRDRRHRSGGPVRPRVESGARPADRPGGTSAGVRRLGGTHLRRH